MSDRSTGDNRQSLTYQQLDDAVGRVARYLRQQGIERGQVWDYR